MGWQFRIALRRCISTSSLPTPCKSGGSRRGRRLRPARRKCSSVVKIASKNAVLEINVISSAATAKKAHDATRLSTDTKNRPFLGRFGRKTGVRGKVFDALKCVFSVFLRLLSSQVIAFEQQASIQLLQKKSYLKAYRRFLGFGRLW